VNGDGIVDIRDLVLVRLAFGSEPGEPDWNPEADLNRDGIIDIIDATILRSQAGETC